MATLSIQPDSFHSEWNYTILPRTASLGNVISWRLLSTHYIQVWLYLCCHGLVFYLTHG